MAEQDQQQTPVEWLSRLPVDRPVFMLASSGRASAFARRSIALAPSVRYRFNHQSELVAAPSNVNHDVVRRLEEVARGFTHDPLRDVDALLATTRGGGGCWAGMLAYELGGWVEPTARGRHGERDANSWPIVELGWCAAPHVFDHEAGRWANDACDGRFEDSDVNAERGWRAGALQPTVSRARHIANVARAIEHIRAGDIFQANVTQQFVSTFEGSTRALAQAALSASGAWYGAMLELLDGRTIVSMSPELFLSVDAATRLVMTRPIKGTRPRTVDVSELERSEKDQAELAMIVDLMRNDLGRVCEIGSIQVPRPRTIETHGEVHQGVGEVAGVLRDDVSCGDLLRATFPPGSITGAPKIRAMQIIDELEASPRGPYCGAIGMIADSGDITLSVAIRTIALAGERPANRFDALTGTLNYGAGGGIVVDSDPESEWEEALAKTQLLRALIARTSAPPGKPGAM